MNDVIRNYKYACFWTDQQMLKPENKVTAYSLKKKSSENLLGSKLLVENILTSFEDNPLLGILSPTPPNNAENYSFPGWEWTKNYDNTAKLLKKLELNTPISPDKPPIAPFDGAFWFRVSALIKMFDYGWKYDDFPEGSLPNDGTLMHAIQRLYPFVSQDAGYYPSFVSNHLYAQIEYLNQYFYIRSINIVLHKHKLGHYTFGDAMRDLGKKLKTPVSLRAHMKQDIKRGIKKWLIGAKK
jgi:rhamnosyltransferase